jgi:hypothetical protein
MGLSMNPEKYIPPSVYQQLGPEERDVLNRQMNMHVVTGLLSGRPLSGFPAGANAAQQTTDSILKMREAEKQAQQDDALRGQLGGIFGSAGPQSVAPTPEANAERGNLDGQGNYDRRASANRYFQAARVFASQGQAETAKKYVDTGLSLHPNPSEAIRDIEYLFGSSMAGQGEQGLSSLMDYQRSKQPQTSVNVNTASEFGTIPPGYRLRRNPDGSAQMDVIPGSPAAREIEDDERKRAQAGESQGVVAGFTLRDARIVNEAIDSMTDNPIVRLGKAKIPGTAEYRANQFMDSLRGTVAIEQLLNIKRQGAGLGQVPQAQLDMLSFLMGKLDMGLPKEDLRLIIGDIQTRYREILKKMTPEDRAQIGIADREYERLLQGSMRDGKTLDDIFKPKDRR